ncbi:MAG TPA: hypothetical protein ENI79_02160 [Rhodospirillales bacterium]|nr:hypothetical protein [Rhodospirillales bacterium]
MPAPPNTRIYDAQGVISKGISVGGHNRITVTDGFDSVSRTRFDGRQGTHAVNKLGKFVRFTQTCMDPTKALTLVNEAPSDAADFLTYYVAKDGTSPTAFVKHTLLRPRYTSLSIRIPESGPATMELAGECLWLLENGVAAAEFHEVHATTDEVSQLTVDADLSNPEIIEELKTVTLAALTLQHRSSLNIRIDGQVRRDRNPGFAGPDSIIWIPDTVRFDLTTKDGGFSDDGTKTSQQDLLDAAAASLVATVGKVNGADDRVFTLFNAKFTEASGEFPFDNYGTFTPNGECEWMSADGTTFYTLGGSDPIMTIGT